MMKFKTFGKTKHLLLEKNGKKSLYELNGETMKPLLLNQKRLDAYSEHDFVVADEAIYSTSGKKLLECGRLRVEVSEMRNYVAIELYSDSGTLVSIAAFSSLTRKIFLKANCCKVIWTDKYVAYTQIGKYGKHWVVYDIEKNIQIMQLKAKNVKIAGDLLITSFPGSYSLYSLSKQKMIKEGQLSILVDESANFAMCASSSGTLSFYFNKWKKLKDVGEFGILSKKHKLFFIEHKSKYFVYTYSGQQLFTEESSKGFDTVAFSEETDSILLINDGVPLFFKQH